MFVSGGGGAAEALVEEEEGRGGGRPGCWAAAGAGGCASRGQRGLPRDAVLVLCGKRGPCQTPPSLTRREGDGKGLLSAGGRQAGRGGCAAERWQCGGWPAACACACATRRAAPQPPQAPATHTAARAPARKQSNCWVVVVTSRRGTWRRRATGRRRSESAASRCCITPPDLCGEAPPAARRQETPKQPPASAGNGCQPSTPNSLAHPRCPAPCGDCSSRFAPRAAS